MRISSCQTRDIETETESSSDGPIIEEHITEKEEMNQKYLNSAQETLPSKAGIGQPSTRGGLPGPSMGSRSVEVQYTEKRKMRNEDLDTARRSVEKIEGPLMVYILQLPLRQTSLIQGMVALLS